MKGLKREANSLSRDTRQASALGLEGGPPPIENCSARHDEDPYSPVQHPGLGWFPRSGSHAPPPRSLNGGGGGGERFSNKRLSLSLSPRRMPEKTL